jgi:prostaglandin-endoperoxide synthase 2
LPEIEDQFTMDIPEEEQNDIIEKWLNRYPRLKIQETDSEDLKAQKLNMQKQIPHSVKVGEELFTRTSFIEDDTTNYLLGCFAQWFVEQAFKTGTDIHARTFVFYFFKLHSSIESMNEEEFKKQWGKNRIDLSNLYGSEEYITRELRLKKDGKLKTQKIKVGDVLCDFPPKITFKKEDIQDDECRQSVIQMFYPKDWTEEQAVEKIYALGHPRFNLHFGLAVLNTLFLREHNSVASMLKLENDDWDDERIFQTTRLILIAMLSKMVVEDYITHIVFEPNFYLEFRPEMFFDTKFQYQERAHFEFNYLYSLIRILII